MGEGFFFLTRNVPTSIASGKNEKTNAGEKQYRGRRNVSLLFRRVESRNARTIRRTHNKRPCAEGRLLLSVCIPYVVRLRAAILYYTSPARSRLRKITVFLSRECVVRTGARILARPENLGTPTDSGGEGDGTHGSISQETERRKTFGTWRVKNGNVDRNGRPSLSRDGFRCFLSPRPILGDK